MRHINMYRQWLGIGTAWHNINEKIWVFVREEYQVVTMMDTDQMLTLHLNQIEGIQEITISIIYASTDRNTRVELWDTLYDLSNQIHTTWFVGGDFNVIVDETEKFGGLPVSFGETEDFIQCLKCLFTIRHGVHWQHIHMVEW